MKTQAKKLDYTCSLVAPIAAKEAFEKIAEVTAWWAQDFSGKAEQLHDRFKVQFGETFVDFEISEVIPNQKVVWEVKDCCLDWQNHKTEWNGTRIIWEAEEKEGKTLVQMTHKGLVPGAECYAACREGWDDHLQNSLADTFAGEKGWPM